ncbi:hypothetical protein, partial [Staphylococcus aureus]
VAGAWQVVKSVSLSTAPDLAHAVRSLMGMPDPADLRLRLRFWQRVRGSGDCRPRAREETGFAQFRIRSSRFKVYVT